MDGLDPGTRKKADELAARVWVDTPSSSPRSVRSALEEAMAEQRVVRIRYLSRDGNPTIRDVEPIMFGSTSGRWDLIGWCRLRSAIRWFLVARIERASVTRIRVATTVLRRSGRRLRRHDPCRAMGSERADRRLLTARPGAAPDGGG